MRAVALAAILVVPLMVLPASAEGDAVRLAFDLDGGGWTIVHLQLAGEDPWAIFDATWTATGTGAADTAVYIVPLAQVVQQPSWLTPWPGSPPIMVVGAPLAAEGVATNWVSALDGPDFVVAVAASTPAHVEIVYDLPARLSLTEVARASGSGAKVSVETAPVGELAALVASVDGASPGWLALDMEVTRTQATSAGVFVTDRAGSIDICHVQGASTSLPRADAIRFHLTRGSFGLEQGRGKAMLFQAQVGDDARVAAAFLPVRGVGDLAFEGDYTSSFTQFGPGASGTTGHGCTF